MNLDPLETTEDPTRRDELVVEGVATPIKGDDDADVSPRAAQENMRFFSQNSVSTISRWYVHIDLFSSPSQFTSQASSMSKSTEDTAHEADKRKHFQKLGSAAFVGMDGLNSPAPGYVKHITSQHICNLALTVPFPLYKQHAQRRSRHDGRARRTAGAAPHLPQHPREQCRRPRPSQQLRWATLFCSKLR